MVTQNERELIDAKPAAGGAGFLAADGILELPQEAAPEVPALDIEDAEMSDDCEPAEAVEAPEENLPQAEGSVKAEDLSGSSTSVGRVELASEREQKRQVRSGMFFEKKQKERREKREKPKAKRPKDLEREVVRTPVLPALDPDLDDFRSPAITCPAPIAEEPDFGLSCGTRDQKEAT
eukprot:s2397_g17.t1